MAENKKISKKMLMEKLFQMGANVELLKMPAVLERTYSKYLSGNSIDIGENGEILIDNGVFSLKNNGEAKYQTNDFKVSIDSYGMESKIFDKTTNATITRKNNKIYYEEPYDGMYFGPYDYEYDDNCMPTLEDVHLYSPVFQEYLSLTGSLLENMGYLIVNYPQTEGWFIEKGILPEKPESKDILIRDAIKSVVKNLSKSINLREDSDLESENFNMQEQSVIKEIKDYKKILETEGIISIPAKTYSNEESEKNRLAYFEKEIDKYEKLSKKEDAKIDLLEQFIEKECNTIPILGKRISKVLSDMHLESEPDNKFEESKSLLSNRRGKLDYTKKEVTRKTEQREKMKNMIIKECDSIPVIGEQTRKIIFQKMNSFFETHSEQDTDDRNDR